MHDARCCVLETWKFSGVPTTLGAWSMRAAKNRTLDLLGRERTARAHAPGISAETDADADAVAALCGDEQTVADAELRMMFACCPARLAPEVQVALVLSLLGGFAAREIASPFFVSEAAMEKRLARGKETRRAAGKLSEVTHERVVANLVGARIGGRVDDAGDLVPLEAQDRSRWDAALVARGVLELEASAIGDVLTAFHVEATIAYEHAVSTSHATTRWDRIAAHYDLLMRVRPSPVVALSRAIAIGEIEGPERALEEIARIENADRLAEYPFHAAAIAEQELRAGRPDRAREGFERARSLARSPAEEAFFARRVAALGEGPCASSP